MSKTFKLACGSCKHETEFVTADIADLYEEIFDRVEAARCEGYDDGCDDGRRDAYVNPDYSDVSAIVRDGRRPLWELSAAIRRGDLAEAELQLDHIAQELGDSAVEQVEQARFGYRAKVPA